MAREEVVPPLLLHPPLVNHPPLTLTMIIMMEMTKGPRVQALIPLLILSIRCQMTFLKSFQSPEDLRRNLLRGGNPGNAGGTVNVHGCSHKTFMNGKPYSFNGTEDVVGLRR
ncbi:hypothetical protein Tco_0063779 [Tanacetum coccineum]